MRRLRTPARRGGRVVPSSPARAVSPGGFHPAAGEIRESRLPNGVRVLSEAIPGVRSVTVGTWLRHGSAHDPPELTGASHLLEHLVFKGTGRRGPREIALSLERLGGSLDAFTSREHTSFQARVLPEHLPVALDVLSDLVLDPLLREEDLELERDVVLEEIAMVEDAPDDFVFELHGEALWGGHPYGRSILGSRESVSRMEADRLRELHERRYRRGDVIVAAAGYLDHDAFEAAVARYFEGIDGGRKVEVPEVGLDAAPRTERVERETTQSHLVFGTRVPPRTDPLRFPLVLLAAAFGGGMGSRLFQRVREELALAYTVYAFQSFYARAGVTGVYVGTRPGWEERVAGTIRDEYRKLAREGLGETELREVKDQVKGQIMLSLESTSARLFRLAGFALYDQPYMDLDGLLETIEAVDRGGVAAAAEQYFDPERQVLLHLGPGGAEPPSRS